MGTVVSIKKMPITNKKPLVWFGIKGLFIANSLDLVHHKVRPIHKIPYLYLSFFCLNRFK